MRLAALPVTAGRNSSHGQGSRIATRRSCAARSRKVPIRIGVNGGSLQKDILSKHGFATAEALVESALRHVTLLEAEDYREIKISVKASDVSRTLEAYRLLSERTVYPLTGRLSNQQDSENLNRTTKKLTGRLSPLTGRRFSLTGKLSNQQDSEKLSRARIDIPDRYKNY